MCKLKALLCCSSCTCNQPTNIHTHAHIHTSTLHVSTFTVSFRAVTEAKFNLVSGNLCQIHIATCLYTPARQPATATRTCVVLVCMYVKYIIRTMLQLPIVDAFGRPSYPFNCWFVTPRSSFILYTAHIHHTFSATNNLHLPRNQQQNKILQINKQGANQSMYVILCSCYIFMYLLNEICN